MSRNYPLISIIIPIYNVEKYLSQTLDCIINQDIGFEKNIELILVNDGSFDDSESVCLRYQSKFPDNITYIKQENAGVSKARNVGTKVAKGKYIHFMDSDDIISKNYYKKSIDLLELHQDKIDFVASKILFFDGHYGAHHLNSKFKHTRLIDIKSEPDKSIFHLPTTVIRRGAIKNITFDTRLVVTEDTKFLTEVLRKQKTYGVVADPIYYYRKRPTSTISGKLRNRKYYLYTPKYALEDILNTWSTEDGIERYAQWLVMNDLAWKFIEEKSQSVLSKNEVDTYKNALYRIIKRIDDEVIIYNSILSLTHKVFLLKKKHSSQYDSMLHFEKGIYYFNGIKLFIPSEHRDSSALVFEFIHNKKNGELFIEGFPQNGLIGSKDKWFIRSSKGDFTLNSVKRVQKRDGFLGDNFTEQEAFEVKIEVSNSDEIAAYLRTQSGDEVRIPIFTKNFTGLGPIQGTYRQDRELIIRSYQDIIQVHENTKLNRLKFEIYFLLRVVRNLQLRQVLGWVKRNIILFPAMLRFMSKKQLLQELVSPFALLIRSGWMGVWDVLIRQLYLLGLYKSSRPIWLISDRGTVAGDNGEALYRYICGLKQKDIEVYFVIDKKSPDYDKLRKIGKVLDVNSLKYKIMFLRADKVISSHADYYVYNAFGYRWTHFNDLYSFDFIFLQHGITKDDMSGWLNRFEKNIKLFITASGPEYDSILKYPYYYTQDEVVLTGFPRFDRLKNHPAGKVMLAPTWRHNLLEEERHHVDGIRAYSNIFKNTEYFIFYNSLINNSRVIKALKDANMKGEFFLHPAFSRQARDFSGNKYFEIKTLPYDYPTAFKESNILITDYSSVAFDFAYLQKPIIYTQFDKTTLSESHIYEEGYFVYSKNGFGEVVYDLESTVGAIVSTIKQGAHMDSKYKGRVESFFYYTDTENSRRVYDAIKQ